jgi:hypothetical protein
MPLTLTPPSARWQDHLTDLGFIPARDRNGYRLNGTLFTTEGGWPTLQTSRAMPSVDPLRGHLGKPGLWKLVRSARGRGAVRVFELPPVARAPSDDEDEEGHDPSAACLKWALATSAGQLPDGWRPPPRHEVEAWVPAGGLTVQSGPVVRQGELIHAAERLALRFPILPAVPAELPEPRREWLYEVLRDGQDRWRLVRIGLTGSGTSEAVWAEVDMTGCPGPVLEGLFRAGLGALRWVVEWLAGSAVFLADPAVGCRALEVCPVRV